MVKLEDVEREARGQWGYILAKLAPSLREAIDAGSRKHVPCPVHSPSRDGFRLLNDWEETGAGCCNSCGTFPAGIPLLRWANGWSFKESLDAVADCLGMSDTGGEYTPRATEYVEDPRKAEERARADEKKCANLKAVWEQSVDILDPAAEPLRLYMVRRGLEFEGLNSETIRFHPSLPYFLDGEKNMGHFPTMVCAVVDSKKKPVTIHRTFLQKNGKKAPFENCKKAMAIPSYRDMSGASIWLSRPGRVIAVTEGVETGLAVLQGTEIPTFPAINTTCMKNFIPMEGVETVLVFGDKDIARKRQNGEVFYPGQEAASELFRRLRAEGFKSNGYIPSDDIPAGKESIDWLDVYVKHGQAGFGQLATIMRKGAVQ